MVQVFYDREKITFQELVEVFFATHDPTTLNRQGPDYGKQVRSVAFYPSPEEKDIIETHIQKLENAGKYRDDIVTEVQPLKKFWETENYHQDYYRLNPSDPYVVCVARPKVRKFQANYRNKLKPEYRDSCLTFIKISFAHVVQFKQALKFCSHLPMEFIIKRTFEQ